VRVAAFGAAAGEPPAGNMTWQEANKRSAELVKDKKTIQQGAELARLAFDLYPQQTNDYRVASHAQLLLNAVDARWKAGGSDAGRDELDRGIGVVMQKTEPNDPVFIDLWRQGAAISAAGSRENERYNEQALAAAEQAWGPDDPRTIRLLLSTVHEQRQRKGQGWTRTKFTAARERAAKHGEDSALVADIDLLLAKLDLESGRKSDAIEKFQALIARLEPRTDREHETTLLMAYSMLEVAYEARGNPVLAAETRQRRVVRQEGAFDPDAIIPTARSAPEYPRQALRNGQEGVVDVEVRVNPDGTVADAQVIRSDPPGVFDEAALRAIRKWKFKPKVVDGKPVEATGSQRIEFRMR
jgi:TonB family protein